jgi:chromate transport protein ChrA
MTSASPPEPPTATPAGTPSPAPPAEQVGLWPLVSYFLTLGTIGFGGPVALTGYMHRDLVEQRRWISEEDYKKAWPWPSSPRPPGRPAGHLPRLCPPWPARRHPDRRRVPGTVVRHGPGRRLGLRHLPRPGLAPGPALRVGAAVIAIIAHQATKLSHRTLGRDRLLAAIFLVIAAVTVATESENGLLILAAGVLVWLIRARPHRLRLPWPGRGLAALLPLPAAVTAPAADPGRVVAARGLLRPSRRGRVRLRPGHRAVPVRRGGRHLRVADRPAVPRRGRRGPAHPRPGGHHHGVHRLPGRRPARRRRRRRGHLPALLSAHHRPGPRGFAATASTPRSPP